MGVDYILDCKSNRIAIKNNKFQSMKKHIANVITGSRIVFSLPLLFIPLTVIGVVLRALSALRIYRYDRWYCGKKDGRGQSIWSKA